MPERWRRITEIFHSALAREESGRRAAFLDEACAGDSELRADVEGLLDGHSDAGSFGEPLGLAGKKPRLNAGGALGPYRIDGLIGAGGRSPVSSKR